MKPVLRLVGAVVVLVLVALKLDAHVRLVHPSSKNPLYWQNPGSISIVTQSAGSQDIEDGSHFTALRNAISAWNAVPGSNARLVENTNPLAQASTDWHSDDLHMVLFDEANSSGYFPFGSGIVAITPIWFFSNGRISDADILFNGSGFQFTTSGVPGRFDVQDVAAHEIGHLLGLDHSGWSGATMFPYVDSTVILHRSLAADDNVGLRSAYPAATFATISGRIERADGSGIAHAQVVALDQDGRTRAGILAGTSGNFTLTGLDAGTYTLYATPLDGPITAANLTGGQVVAIDFQPTWYPTPVAVAAGGSASAATLVALPDATINLGRPTDRLPLRATSGQETLLSLRGTGLAAGSALTCSDPTVTISVQNWLGSAVIFRVTVAADALPGHADLVVTNLAGEQSVLSAALEFAPPNPTVSAVNPTVAGSGGGAAVVLTGTGFRPGARVVVGPRIYADGEPGGAVVLGPTSIQLTLAATPPGVYDVAVIDATGVEGRKVGALTAAELPSLESVFPAVGSAAGGTLVRVGGADFAPGALVRIDGLPQNDVIWVASNQLDFTTSPALPGGPYVLEVENPGGYVASSAFAFVSEPDPLLVDVQPAVGPAAGGSVVTLLGTGFSADSEVVFGAHPVTGEGGTPASSVVFVDSTILAVVTPPVGAGAATVVVRAPKTGQAAFAPESFVFQKSPGSGGGGCHIRSIAPGSSGGSGGLGPILQGGLWMLILAAVAAIAARQATRRLATRRLAH